MQLQLLFLSLRPVVLCCPVLFVMLPSLPLPFSLP